MSWLLRAASMALGIALGAACGSDPNPPQTDPTSLRSLSSGEVVGLSGEYGSHAWLGIPYAEPPVGELRWRSPRPPENLPASLEALASGPPCTQLSSVFSGGEIADAGRVIGDEDCLTLDIWAPRFEADRVPTGEGRLPVMFWIHGGGSSIGAASFYDGGNLAATRDVVVIAINYRLGPFGWFRHASLRGEGTTAADRSGNYATLDMIQALHWVRENVSAFGGDPGNVTIFGESAGGTHVLALMLSPLGHGLFHRAVIQSGGMGTNPPEYAEGFSDGPRPGHRNSSNEILAKLLVTDGSAADGAAARAWIANTDDPEIAVYLRQKSNGEILEAYRTHSAEGMLDFAAVLRDGYVIPRQETAGRLTRGAYNQVPVMLGTNRDENKLFMALDPLFVDWRLGLFPKVRDPEVYAAHGEHSANAWKARSVDVPASSLRRAQGATVYAYRWDWDEEPSIPFLVDGPALVGGRPTAWRSRSSSGTSTWVPRRAGSSPGGAPRAARRSRAR